MIISFLIDEKNIEIKKDAEKMTIKDIQTEIETLKRDYSTDIVSVLINNLPLKGLAFK